MADESKTQSEADAAEQRRAAAEQAALDAEARENEMVAARADGVKAERAARQKHAGDLRKQYNESLKNPAMSREDRWSLEHAAIQAELALKPRDEFHDHPPYFIQDGMKVGPNGRPLGSDGREVPGERVEWMPVATA